MKKVEDVSEVFCRIQNNNNFSYGFTVTYSDGSFNNIIKKSSVYDDESILKQLKSKRQFFLDLKDNKQIVKDDKKR